MAQAAVQDRITVGSVQMIALFDTVSHSLASVSSPGVPATEWAKYPGVVSPEGRLKTNSGCFLIHFQGI